MNYMKIYFYDVLILCYLTAFRTTDETLGTRRLSFIFLHHSKMGGKTTTIMRVLFAAAWWTPTFANTGEVIARRLPPTLTITVPPIGSLDAVGGQVIGLANPANYKACVYRESRSTTYDGQATSFVQLQANGQVGWFVMCRQKLPGLPSQFTGFVLKIAAIAT